MEENLIYEILSVVQEIPEGSVATYGQIAKIMKDRIEEHYIKLINTILYNYREHPEQSGFIVAIIYVIPKYCLRALCLQKRGVFVSYQK